MNDKKPSLLSGMLCCRCPECRKGRIFQQKGLFPLRTLLRMNEYCPHCGQKLIGETNNGPGINYALTTILLFLNILWYYPIFGLSYLDNSIFYFLAASVTVVILLQPVLMRLSRSIYLYILLAFQE
ncbi:MAG: DUF983 domain-containing protein [Chitinophagaceae bacterium]|nr:DUF983 domain-containing protein [Chitinophagaceae bacterium]